MLDPILYAINTSDMPIDDNLTVAAYTAGTALILLSELVEATAVLQRQLNVVEKWKQQWNEPNTLLNRLFNCLLDKKLTWMDHIKFKRKYLDARTNVPALGVKARIKSWQ